MNRKHASLIRHGINMARTHVAMYKLMVLPGMDRTAYDIGKRTIEETTPKHPLAVRAYVHTLDNALKAASRPVQAKPAVLRDGFHA